jgi:hypothetical protein
MIISGAASDQGVVANIKTGPQRTGPIEQLGLELGPREAARSVDKFLMGATNLPSVNAGDFAWR